MCIHFSKNMYSFKVHDIFNASGPPLKILNKAPCILSNIYAVTTLANHIHS